MPVDIDAVVSASDLADLLPGTVAAGLQGSRILAIAGHVNQLVAEGQSVVNFTIGDFAKGVYGIPRTLRDEIVAQLDAGETHYAPAAGLPELRHAIRAFYADRLGMAYPEGSVVVGAGARPPIYATFRTLLDPGDVVVYPVPCWNIRYYVYLTGAKGVVLQTSPDHGFLPTVDDLLPHIGEARLVALNSPANPAGTVIDPDALKGLCDAIVDENRTRRAQGRKPCMLMYDQVYWQLTFPGHRHATPPELNPEMAAYTIHIDAISKCWAATGVRVGWAVAPPPLVEKMRPLVGHMGAWSPRAEQMATARLLAAPARVDPFLTEFRGSLQTTLQQLSDGILAMKADGLPIDAFSPQGAIYLSARFNLTGRTVRGHTIGDDESLRRLLLEEAGVAVVPFSAFGYPDGSGWVRFSVGAVTPTDVSAALERIRELVSDA